MIDEARVRAMLQARYEKAGSMRALATEAGVTVAYIHDVLHGRRAVGPTLLALLGIEKVVTTSYRRAQS